MFKYDPTLEMPEDRLAVSKMIKITLIK